MPPPWRRSLVESGMSPRLSRVDKVVIGLFPLVVVALLVVLALAS